MPEASGAGRLPRSRAVLLTAALLLAGGCASGTPAHAPTATRPPVAARTSPVGVQPSASLPVPTGPATPFVSPIQPYNKPTPVPGDTNGQMPSDDLVRVAPNCVAYRPAGPSLELLLATARDDGVVLGTEECYRPLSGEVAVRQNWSAAGNSSCAAPVVTAPSGPPKGTSMHGWGKAADFTDSGGTMTFGSPGYRFLTETAGRFGWNHPAWARPGGSTCPEAWHWEWVGDGGVQRDSPVRADVVGILPAGDGRGYSTVTGLGGVIRRGDGPDFGSAAGALPAWLITGAARTADANGYRLVGYDGGVFCFGDARYFGSTAGAASPQPTVAIASTPGGDGYWLLTAGGQVSAFGSARFYGSPASLHPARPAVGVVSTRDGRGYWVVASDGAVFSYGDARFYGAASGRPLPAPVIAMAATPDGHGYWLAGSDGSVYAFGDARRFGDAAGLSLAEPVVAMASTPDGRGYWLAAADGGVFGYGDASFYGAG